MQRKAFTLIELLVVIAIIAILAAILFPVFAQAKLAAKKASDLSNLKQMGISTMLYLNDYDDMYYPHRINCNNAGGTGANEVCPQYLDGSGNLIPQATILGNSPSFGTYPALGRYFYVYLLQPYTKNYSLFNDPAGSGKFNPNGVALGPACTGAGCVGNGYGGQNSYGHNDMYLSPAAPFGGGGSIPAPVNESQIPRVASTILLTDSTYYGAAFDVDNESGLTNLGHMNGNELARFQQLEGAGNTFYENYWKNIGDSNWSYSGGDAGPLAKGATGMPQLAINLGKGLFGNVLNCQFTDGHAKAMPYNSVVGDVCFWTTDVEGAHPACGS